MRFSLICTAAVSALSLATAASAQDAAAASEAAASAPEAAAVKNGEWIYSSDGSSIGRVDHIQKGKDGASSAAIIYQMRMVYVPLDSLSAGKKGYVTKLTRAEVNKLK